MNRNRNTTNKTGNRKLKNMSLKSFTMKKEEKWEKWNNKTDRKANTKR